MINTSKDFYGKQTDERILYMVHPHPVAATFSLIRVYLAALVVVITTGVIAHEIFPASATIFPIGLLVSLVIILIGTWIVKTAHKKNKTYITDRRIIRFEPTTTFATNIRSLTWDEVVKVKTYPTNFFFKQLKIGNVIVHARTTVRTSDDELQNKVTVDDIEMKNVYYYRDLGNYIDKILFTYKNVPESVKSIKPFVAKPKGQRD